MNYMRKILSTLFLIFCGAILSVHLQFYCQMSVHQSSGVRLCNIQWRRDQPKMKLKGLDFIFQGDWYGLCYFHNNSTYIMSCKATFMLRHNKLHGIFIYFRMNKYTILIEFKEQTMSKRNCLVTLDYYYIFVHILLICFINKPL